MRPGIAAVVAGILLVSAAPQQPEAKITALEVRLFDAQKGEFSANVLEDGVYGGWNTFMMEGNAGYGRGDAVVIVKVALSNPNPDGGYATLAGPLVISATRKGKLLAQRRFQRIQTNSREVARLLFLPNIGCAGDVYITAKLQGHMKTARLGMGCGE